MGRRRLTLVVLCLFAVFATAAATARAPLPGHELVRTPDASVPRWWMKETGSLASYTGTSGLTEIAAPETLVGEGEIKIVSNSVPKGERPISDCLLRNRELIEDPAETSLPGTGEMEEFELVCEKGTGQLNAAYPHPCIPGEAFEVKGVAGTWTSTLEASGTRFYDNFPGVVLTVECLKSKLTAEYAGSLRPEAALGRLKFLGSASGELEETMGGGEKFYLKGYDWVYPAKYKNVRVD